MRLTRSSASVIIAIVASVLLTSSAISVHASTQVSFGTIRNLSNNTGVSTAPVVATVNGGQYVYVAWEDTGTGSSTKPQTHIMVNNNFGASNAWSAPTTPTGGVFIGNGLTGGASKQLNAVQIAAEGSYVFLTWQQGGSTAYACSSDNGAHFSYGTISVPSSIATGKMTAQAVSASGDYAYFTWAGSDPNLGTTIVLFSSSHTCATPTTPVKISGTTSTHGEDQSAAVGNYVYVVWDSIYVAVSADNGQHWSIPVQVKPASCFFPCIGREPMISASGSNVYVTFPMGGFGGVSSYSTEIAVSHDHGNTFAPAKDLSSATLSNTREVQVSSYGTDVFVTSRGQGTAKGIQQYVYVSTNSGDTFAAPILVAGSAQSGGESGFGSLTFDQSNENVYVYWPHGTTSQLFAGSSQDLGATWTVQQVSQSSSGVVTLGDPGGSQGPLLSALGGHIYAVWEDTSTGNGDIYIRAGTS